VDFIIYKKEAGIARITLNRPKALNAFTEELFIELIDALNDADSDENIKVIILNGAGKTFSAGMDLNAIKLDGFSEGGSTITKGYQVSDIIQNSEKITIAQVHGFAFTAALELTLFFDMVYCTEQTVFCDSHAKWGLIPRWGLSARLSRRIGMMKAKEMTFTGRRVRGVEAEQIGLVTRAFKDEEELAVEVSNIANQILDNSYKAIQVNKHLYDQRYKMSLDEGIAYELSKDPTDIHTQEELMALVQKNLKSK